MLVGLPEDSRHTSPGSFGDLIEHPTLANDRPGRDEQSLLDPEPLELGFQALHSAVSVLYT